MTAPTAIELFAGCGGMSCGLLHAGFNVRLGVDVNAPAIETYNFNHHHVGARGVVADLRKIYGDHLRELASLRADQCPDLLSGGPPCQSFSIIGKRRGLADERGNLILEYLRLLGELQPSAFIFENVANFATIENGSIAKMLIASMEKEGYAVSDGVLHAAEFGVPQMRRRFVVIGVRGRRRIGLPNPTHGSFPLLGQQPLRPCRDALGDLPDVDTEEALRFWNHEGTCHSPAMVKTFESLKPGERDPKSHHDRLDPERPSYTLRAGNGNFSPLRPIHYRFNRVISVRESARLQGFPDWFAWPDGMSRLQQYRQVGNAVPPPLATILGQHVARHLGLAVEPKRYSRAPERPDVLSLRTVEDQVARRRSFIRGASVGRTA